MNNFITYSKAALFSAFESIGINSGDEIIFHSSIIQVGLLEDVDIPNQPKELLAAIMEYLGPQGTVVVPAGFWDYGLKGVPYDTGTSPVAKDLGVVPKFLVTLPEAGRSLNPLYAVAAIGAKVDFFTGTNTAIAFGSESPWKRLAQVNAKNVFFGTELDALMFARYCEQCEGVPYIYNKLYDAPIYRDGVLVGVPVVTPVRYSNLMFEYNLSGLASRLNDRGHLFQAPLGGGNIEMVSCNNARKAISEGLCENIHYLLKSPPNYKRGEIPFDVLK